MTKVPKRAFKSADQENLFRAMIKRHITDSGLKHPNETEYTSSLTPPDWRSSADFTNYYANAFHFAQLLQPCRH
jgi:hypothetical protein